jgi:hypothetical protein
MESEMFTITSKKGFHITLPNGITISTQFGAGNYCSNYDEDIVETMNTCAKSIDAEIAIWNKEKTWVTPEIMKIYGEDYTDDVWGNVDIEKWLKILDICKNYEV